MIKSFIKFGSNTSFLLEKIFSFIKKDRQVSFLFDPEVSAEGSFISPLDPDIFENPDDSFLLLERGTGVLLLEDLH